MPNYRRLYVPGGTYFFTVVTHRRQPLFAEPANVQALRTAVRRVRDERPFQLAAAVVLPDHLHMIWTLPHGDSDYSRRLRLIKQRFTLTAPRRPVGPRSQLWQRRFREHLIRDENDLRRHLDYVHYNPVKHGLVQRPQEWPYSSLKRYEAAGLYESGWGACAPTEIDGMGWE